MASAKKEQRKEQHRLEILQAAEQIFAHHGYHTTTMEQVAESCGWSKGTLYLYFKSKEDLFFSILIEKMEQFSATLLAELRHSIGIEDKIATLIDAQFGFFSENENFFQLILAEQGKVMQGSDSGLREKMINIQHINIDQISQALNEAMPECCTVNSAVLTASIIGAINLQLVAWLMAPESHDLNQIKQQITTLFVNGIKCNENN